VHERHEEALRDADPLVVFAAGDSLTDGQASSSVVAGIGAPAPCLLGFTSSMRCRRRAGFPGKPPCRA
jgi:hypothetical protein